MDDYYDLSDYFEEYEEPWIDDYEIEAEEVITEYIHKNKDKVFYSRQLEVLFENKFFHWVTNRAIRELEGKGVLLIEGRKLIADTKIHIVWDKSLRYYKREANKLIALVEKYSASETGFELGRRGEDLVLEGFARNQFLLINRNTNKYKKKKWEKTNHKLDFIFERDSLVYGVEVKNTLGYMDKKELDIKIDMCSYLGIIPIFVARMLPQSWIHEIIEKGGFALILKYHLYPTAYKKLAKEVAQELKIPTGCPKVLEEGTMKRFLNWHQKHVNLKTNSQKE